MTETTIKNKVLGCLIGGAVGDALGYPIEFMSRYDIHKKYNEDVKDYILSDGIALISDDTQMSMFTATGLNQSKVLHNIDEIRENVYKSYLDWYKTQTTYEVQKGFTWLSEVSGMYSRRAPGNTCMSSLESGKCGSVKSPINMRKGCGGVMRVAPVGLHGYLRNYSPYDSGIIGAEVAAITHGHFLGIMPAMVMAYVIHSVMNGNSVKDATIEALKVANSEYRHSLYRKKFIELMECALDLATEDNVEDANAIWTLGEGWTGDEALAISIYCAVKYENDFEKAVVAAVNHNGDSDSTGAITGNIIGTKLGINGIPQKYKDNLELYNIITKIANEMMDTSIVSIDENSEYVRG